MSLLNVVQSGADAIGILQKKLKLPEFRALQCARFLEYCDRRFAFLTFHVVGTGARQAFFDILDIAPADRKSYCFSGCDFAKLRALLVPLLEETGEYDVVRELESIGIDVLSCSNLQHLCCELRKVFDTPSHYEPRPGYRDLWFSVRNLEDGLSRQAKRGGWNEFALCDVFDMEPC